ncbi:YncE family protein [Actinoplanes sp. CA-131856]
MMRIRAALTAAAVTCAAVTATVVGAAGPAAAAAAPVALGQGAYLPISGVGEMAVDPLHKRVLITDPSTHSLLSLSYFGGVQKRVPAGWSAYGLTLSPDYSTVYVASPDDHKITAFDAATLNPKRTYDLGEAVWPRQLAVASGKIWMIYDGGMGSVDPVSGATVLHQLNFDGNVLPQLLTAPGAPGTLVVANAWRFSVGNGDTYVYDVSSGEAVLKTKSRFGDGTLRDVALTPDGSTLIGFGDECPIWKAPITDPAAKTTAYDNGICRPLTVGINTDGRVAFGYGNQNGTADITISPAGSEAAAEQFTVGAGQAIWWNAWEPGGNRLFAIGDVGEEWRFHAIHGSAPVRSTITLSAPATAVPGSAIQFTGKVSQPGARVELYVDTNSPGDKQLVTTATANASGQFTLVDKRPEPFIYDYTVVYAGTDSIAPASASASVTVERTPVLTLSHNNTVNNYGSTVTLTAHLGTTGGNRSLQIWADPYGTEPQRLLRWANADAKGNLTTSLKLTRTTAVQVKFTGDSQYAATSARSVLNTRVALNLTPSRQYKAAKIGSVPYRFYHANVHPYFLTTMTPYPGRKQRLVLDVYSGGAWKPWRVLYLPLSSAGKSAFTLTGTHPVGAKYRARADYVTTSSGDSVNYTTIGSYYYFTFTK